MRLEKNLRAMAGVAKSRQKKGAVAVSNLDKKGAVAVPKDDDRAFLLPPGWF